jgi:L-alanine-DL-glutamate epimerase-like enolase superfamily enzyme
LESSSLVHEQGVNEGKIHLPTGPGLGVDIDPGFLNQHQKMTA